MAGGFSSGSADVLVYDRRRHISKKGVVFVSINYRVGVLGFLASPGIEKWNQSMMFPVLRVT